MLFKQVKIFKCNLGANLDTEAIESRMQPYAYQPCLPSLASTKGWVSPVTQDPETTLIIKGQNAIMFCMMIEEKVLPQPVIKRHVDEEVKKIENEEARKVGAKEKQRIKDEVIHTLLPRAFSKLTPMHAYIDTELNYLVINTTNAKRIERFNSFLKRSLGDIEIKPLEVSEVGPMMTSWVLDASNPSNILIDQAAVLQDPNQQNRVIRCQHQDLGMPSIQGLINDGCAVKQLALNWNNQLSFCLDNEFSLSKIKFADELLETAKEAYDEAKLQQFSTDFVMMRETFAKLLANLTEHFSEEAQEIIA